MGTILSYLSFKTQFHFHLLQETFLDYVNTQPASPPLNYDLCST